ncbi:MAG: hypothetical protein ABDI20_09800 [Candidatus Bipolaricaulaceae bacterium]
MEAAIRALREKLEQRAESSLIRTAMEELKKVAGEVAEEVYRQTATTKTNE